VVKGFFPLEKDPQDLAIRIFKAPIWFDLNLGKLTEKEAIQAYSQFLDLPPSKIEELMDVVRESLIPLEGSFELLDELYEQGVPLYSITDNIVEIIDYLKKRYNFLHKFKGVIVSGEIGVLKPSPIIYQTLLEKYELIPQECIFIDDLEKNIIGAREVGIHGIVFSDAQQCRQELRRLGVHI
jgi:putative hydrolase of the HAD superfamily